MFCCKCISNLLNNPTSLTDRSNRFIVVYFDTVKAFDCILYQNLVPKLRCFGVSDPLLPCYLPICHSEYSSFWRYTRD